MTVSTKTLSATVPVSGTATALDPEGGNATLDEGWSPYGQATLTIPIPSDEAILDALDPRSDPLVTINATQSSWTNGTGWSDPISRELELLVRGRVVDHNAETVTLTLATAEAKLQDYKLIASQPITSYLQLQSSLRNVCAAVVGDVANAAIEPGDADADFTTTASATNMLLDPNMTGIAGGGYSASACTVDNADTSWHAFGTNCFNLYSPTSTDSFLMVGPSLAAGAWAFGMQVGHTYTFTGYGRVKVAGTGTDYAPTGAGDQKRARALVAHTQHPGGSYLGSYDVFASAQLPSAVGSTARLSVTFTIPEGSTGCVLRAYNGNSATQQVQWDALMLVEGDGKDTDGVNLIPYFDGSTAADEYYTYAWDNGTANLSTSTRKPRIDRTPDALTWQPGTSAWDFLTPALQQAGLRLFADELGVWRLVDSTYSVDGRVVVNAGFNAYEAQDTISRDLTAEDGSPLWFDGCVIKYSWIDSTGTQQQAWDAYPLDGSATQAAYFEHSYAYPGPGMAEHYVKSANGHGRTLALTAAVDYLANPGMEASSTLPGTESQTGRVASVGWDFGADTMTVGTKGLVDTPASAWLQLAPGEAWTDSATGASWTNEVV